MNAQYNTKLINGIYYSVCEWTDSTLQCVVSGTEFDRYMSRVEQGQNDVRTVVFPSTVREVRDRAFENSK